MSKVIVIGGGPAGMAAAVSASRAGHEVILLEKNEKLGKKLFITGKGRCNVTNDSGFETHIANIVSNEKFMYSCLRKTGSAEVMSFIEGEGCPLKTERGQRVFPVSDHSSSVIKAWSRALDEAGVKVRLHTQVRALLTEDGVCRGVRLHNNTQMKADAVIVATGGISYSSTGSTGDGYQWARASGHRVTELRAALVPLVLAEKQQCASMMGLSLKNIRAGIYDGDKTVYEDFGEMLFTHFGVSGPIILSASSYAAPLLKKQQLVLKIDLKPALDEEKLDERVLRDFDKYRNKELKNALSELLPSGLIAEVIRQSGIEPAKQVNEITRDERRHLIKALKGLTYTVTGTRGFEEAIVTQGGINVKDIDPKTMASKLVNGLYFAGEVLDVDALTGGFNLQIAWSTGFAAGAGVV